MVGWCESTTTHGVCMQLPVHLYGAQFFALFGPAVHGLCRWVLVRLARPHLGPSGELLEAGADLSDNYISEYVDYYIIISV